MKTISLFRRPFYALASLFLFGISSTIHAQGTFTFAAPTDGAGTATAEVGRSICSDANGNVYIVGVFNSGGGLTDFDLNSASTSTFSSSASTNDGYIASYDKNGNFRWKTIVTGTLGDFTAPAGGICTNGTFVWVAGDVTMGGSPQIMSSTNTVTITSPGSGTDAFVAKLNCSNGGTVWQQAFGGTGALDFAEGICCDPNGCCYVTGAYSTTFTLGSITAPAPNGTSDFFIAKFGVGGNMIRFNSGGALTSPDMIGNGGGLCYVPGATPAIVATGHTGSSNATFGTFTNIPNQGGNDAILIELDTILTYTNVLGIGSNGADELLSAFYDPFSGGVFVCGYNTASVPMSFPSYPSAVTTLNNLGGQDIMIARYSVATNNIIWASDAGGSLNDRGWAITADGQGGIQMAGFTLSAPCTFSGSVVINTNAGNADIYVVRYSNAGTPIWVLSSASGTTEEARGITSYVQSSPFSQTLFITGIYSGAVTMGSTTLNNDGGNDFFLAKINDATLPLSATQSQVNLTCNGVCTGSATVVASGGTAPYTYSWSPAGGSGATASSLCATNYTCTITDAALASITKTFSITQPLAITSSVVSQTNISCNGGSNGAATITAAGGTGSLTYNWTPGNPAGDGTVSVTGLNANTWTCTITDGNSCTRTQTVSITQPNALVVTPLSQTNVSCNGGSNGTASVTVSGGTTAYSYNWTPGNPTGDGTASVTGLSLGTWTCTVTDAHSCVSTATFNITQPTALVVTPLSQTNISCNGGSNGTASVTVSGGTTSYSYNWTPGNPSGDGTASVTGLTAQSYTCTVTDANNCVSTATFNITAPTALVVTPLSQTNISCNGGSNGTASVTVSGGTTSYSYNWTPGNPTGDGTASVTGLTAQTYTCTVTDANSCVSTATFNITQPNALVVTPLSQTNISCNGGSNGTASVTVSGGTTSYSYNWTPGNPTGDGTASVTGLTQGTWTCTVTDANSCVSTATFNITQPNALVVTPLSQTNISCNGGSNGTASVTVSGGTTSYSYNWTPGNPTGDGTASVTGLSVGTWTCTVTDANSCVSTATFNITQPTALVVTPLSQTNISCNGGSNGTASVTVSGGTTSYSYNWTPGNPTGDGTASVTGLTAQTYTCTVTDANSCVSTATFNITTPTALVVTPLSQTNISCNGGSNGTASVTVSGGTTAYSYNWTPGNPTGDGTASVTGLTAQTYTCTVTDANSCVSTATFNITAPTALVVTPLSQTNISCNGGSNGTASVSVSGGTTSYSYNWTPGNPTGDGTASVTGLTAQTYTCTVTDANSCVSTATFNITQPAAIIVTPISQTNISCNGGSNGAASVSASGGAGGLTYNWTPGNPTGDGTASVTGLTAGTWTCTVTDVNSCSNTATFNITQPSALIASAASQTNISCNGGSNGAASVSVTGGTTSYSYNWTPGNPTGDGTASVTGLTAGTWTCTVTDANSCVTTQTFNITEPSPLVASAASQTNISCNGGSNGAASVSVTGGTTSYSYNWTPGNPTGDGTASVTGLTQGTWTCTVTDANSCVTTQTFSITEPSPLVASSASQTNISCNGGSNGAASVSVTGGTTSYSYNWTPGNPTGDGTVSVTGLTAGTWTCTVTDANSCITTQTFNITQPSAITSSVSSQTNISCNGGSNGAATISASGGTGSLTYSWAPSGGNAATATGLTAQTYTCTITDANSCTHTQTVDITEPSALTATSSSTPSTCSANNGSATAAPSGGVSPYTYSWAPSGGTSATASSLFPGSYTCTVTDANGCITTTSVTVNTTGSITASITASTNVSCNGGNNGSATAAPTGGTGPYTYAWTPSGGSAATATGLAQGTYTCTITDSNGCFASATVSITEPTALNASTSQTNISCNGGNDGDATVTASGGTPSYSYSWAPSGGSGATASSLSAGSYTCTITDANGCILTETFSITQPTAITSSVSSQTNVSCNGGNDGSATVSAGGGTPSYSYTWSPSGGNAATATGLAVGNYTCTITDANGCTHTQTVNITQPSAITSSVAAQTDILCNGGNNGSATVAASGGTPSYSYSWTPSGGNAATANGLSAGNYTCTITDASGCTHTQPVIITEPPVLTATSSSTDATCGGNNGSATAVPSGGVSPYTYSWAPSGGTGSTASALVAGSYTCTVTDANGCITTTSVTVNSTGGISASITSSTNISCNGGSDGSATAAPIGGSGPYTYAWSPSGGNGATETGLSAGSYTCTITDSNGCIATTSVTITQPSALTASASQTNISCNGNSDGSATVAVSGGTPSYNYSWSPSGGNAATASSLAPGSYTCTITDANGCQITRTFNITQPSALSIGGSQTNISCNGGSNGSATVTVSGGTPAYSYAWLPSGGNAVTASSLSAGTYTCNVTDANGCIISQTFALTQPSTALSVVMSKTDATCTNSDGSATASPSGGTPGYTYMWTPSGQTTQTAINLAAGNYTCTITDANECNTIGSITVNATPCGPTQMAQCGIIETTLNQTLNCVAVPNATNYQYKIMQGTTLIATYTRGNNLTNILLSNISTITYGQTYQISVRAAVNNAWGTFGPACNITTPPFPAGQVSSTSCGVTLASFNDLINCNPIVGATNYQWKFMQGATLISTYLRGTNIADCRLVNVPGTQYGQTYDVYVRAFVGGVWGPYGTFCNVTSPPFPTTQVSSVYCGTTLPTISSGFSCDAVPGATNYQWKVVNTSLGYSSTITTSNNLNTWRLSNHPGILAFTTYTVTVRANVGGWGPFGPACTLTTGHSSRLGDPDSTNSGADLNLEIFPNPTTGILTIDAGKSVINKITVTDVSGRLVNEFQPENSNYQVNLSDEENGIYFITVWINDSQKVFKVIKNE